MHVPSVLRDARERAGLTQSALAARAGTSQATLSAYEAGRKEPSVATLSRILTATGRRLAVGAEEPRTISVAPEQIERRGWILAQVLDLAEALPYDSSRPLRYPPLARTSRRRR